MNYIAIPGLPHARNFRRENICLVQNTPERIIKEVSTYLDISFESMQKRTRKRKVCYARQLCMYFMCAKTALSLKSIGEMFGERDHTTVIHSRQLIKGLLDVDYRVIKDVAELSNMF